MGATSQIARYYAEADGDARVALWPITRARSSRWRATTGSASPGVAEVAFAVSQTYQGRGAGTRLLEQLAGIAAAHGIHRFDAEVLSDNRKMMGVFRSAGFGIRRQGFGGEVRLSLDIRPTATLAEKIAERDHRATVASLQPMLNPRSVAVVGASNAPGSVGGGIVANIVDGGFDGVVYPVNRTRSVVRSIARRGRSPTFPRCPTSPSWPCRREVPGVAEEAAAAWGQGARGRLGRLQRRERGGRPARGRLLTTVRSQRAADARAELLGLLRTTGGRRLDATVSRANAPAGPVAISSQSGALGIALLGHAARRGLGVAAFVALGNRADVSTNDCSSCGRTTRRSRSSCSTWSRSATRTASRRSPGGCRASSRSWPSRGAAAVPSRRAAPRTRRVRSARTRGSTPCSARPG
jgi:GNAT superfamily N-acetyltransferase